MDILIQAHNREEMGGTSRRCQSAEVVMDGVVLSRCALPRSRQGALGTWHFEILPILRADRKFIPASKHLHPHLHPTSSFPVFQSESRSKADFLSSSVTVYYHPSQCSEH
jgi:hypothetical protein